MECVCMNVNNRSNNPNFTSVMQFETYCNGQKITDSKLKTSVIRTVSRIVSGGIQNIDEYNVLQSLKRSGVFGDAFEKTQQGMKLRTVNNYLLTGKHAEMLDFYGSNIGHSNKKLKKVAVVDADLLVDTGLIDARNNVTMAKNNYSSAIQSIIGDSRSRLKSANGNLMKLIVDFSTFGKSNRVNINSAKFETIARPQPTQLNLF